jgi:hypothetical protein
MTFIRSFPFILCSKGENMGANSPETPPQRVNGFLPDKKVWEGVWEEDHYEIFSGT